MRRFIVLAISILVALSVVEAALRWTGWKPLHPPADRTRFWKYHPVLGWAHQPGQVGRFDGPHFRTTIRINQKGLRDREHSYQRTGGSRRILVLGDSFAWGFGVEEEQRFSERLERKLKIEVINAGVSGYSSDQETLWLRDEGTKYDVDLVIVVFCGNDEPANHLSLVYDIYNKPLFVFDGSKLKLTGVPVPKLAAHRRISYNVRQRFAFFELISQAKNQFVSRQTNHKRNFKKRFSLTKAILQEMKAIASLKGSRLLIVATKGDWDTPAETYSELLSELISEGLIVLDVDGSSNFAPEEMLIPNDTHWNAAGHEFVANTIKKYIIRNRLPGE